MIHRIDLDFFKCFHNLRLPLSNLTLLSGANASGKSSILQAFVLLNQTMRDHEWSLRLMLNGTSLKLGTVTDVIDKVNGRRETQVALVDEVGTVRWSFVGDRDDLSMSIERVEVDGVIYDNPSMLRHLIPESANASFRRLAERVRDLSYITAERVGPREFYELADPQAARVVGIAGEHAVSVLHVGRDREVNASLAVQGVPPTLLRQVEARMRLFFPGCGLAVQQVANANAVMLGIRTSDDTDFHRPIHVGFGITQVLPIVVAAISAAPDDLLLIENPEVHLHPRGQAMMGFFLGEVARAGTQVLVETHSDHVLNGVRRAVRSGVLDADQVALHFFAQRAPGRTQAVSPAVSANGSIDFWPDGFFDQFDKDSSYLAGWDA